MLSFPNAKINLGLQIKSKRDDGYHEIETCLYPIPLNDILEIVPSNEDKLIVTGNAIDGKPEENLCYKAIRLLAENYKIPALHVHLHKLIPHGAGLGGGSSDAVHTLQSINKILNLNISENELLSLSSYLGSDCPFFVKNRPSIAHGRGEKIETLELSLKGDYLILVFPKLFISSSIAYSLINPKTPSQKLKTALKESKTEWKKLLQNDFQMVLEKKYSQLAGLSQVMYNHNAYYAAMSGSGSSYFGLFNEDPGDDFKTWFKKDYFVFKSRLNS
ncbi:4-(cytidine 5'-diphospho)-2-C-methyl-D-erythritol kinase [Hyphobacterium sp. CCMP332]|nr:4-(cytidine 5'-diphospho)-2-C-methyl-D-erythritol kinase [Hyphobacterium sp. CCMP332]